MYQFEDVEWWQRLALGQWARIWHSPLLKHQRPRRAAPTFLGSWGFLHASGCEIHRQAFEQPYGIASDQMHRHSPPLHHRACGCPDHCGHLHSDFRQGGRWAYQGPSATQVHHALQAVLRVLWLTHDGQWSRGAIIVYQYPYMLVTLVLLVSTIQHRLRVCNRHFCNHDRPPPSHAHHQ
jgi:hypothetical protein